MKSFLLRHVPPDTMFNLAMACILIFGGGGGGLLLGIGIEEDEARQAIKRMDAQKQERVAKEAEEDRIKTEILAKVRKELDANMETLIADCGNHRECEDALDCGDNEWCPVPIHICQPIWE